MLRPCECARLHLSGSACLIIFVGPVVFSAAIALGLDAAPFVTYARSAN
jgi:hypothetical protein